MHGFVLAVKQLHQFEHGDDALFLLGSGDAEQVGVKIHIGPSRQLFVQRGLLRDGAEDLAHLLRLVAHIIAQHFYLAARGLAQAAEHIDGGRFA